MAEEKWLYRSRQTKTMDTIRTEIYTYPQEIFYQAGPWLVDRGRKLATCRDDALRCSRNDRMILELFSEILFQRVLIGTVVRLIERGKL